MRSPASNSVIVWADRFRISADLAIVSTRSDTATNSKPSSAAVAAPTRTAKSPQPLRTASTTGEFDDERCSGAPLRLNREPTTHSPRELWGDVETEAGAARSTGEGGPTTVELFEDPLLLGRRDAGAGVGDEHSHALAEALDPNPHGTFAAVLDGVVDQVDQHLLD